MLHELKTDAEVFEKVANGSKLYEIRKNDRNFQVGDYLFLRETQYNGELMRNAGMPLIYTDREIMAKVVGIDNGPFYVVPEGWCLMSVTVLDRKNC